MTTAATIILVIFLATIAYDVARKALDTRAAARRSGVTIDTTITSAAQLREHHAAARRASR